MALVNPAVLFQLSQNLAVGEYLERLVGMARFFGAAVEALESKFSELGLGEVVLPDADGVAVVELAPVFRWSLWILAIMAGKLDTVDDDSKRCFARYVEC